MVNNAKFRVLRGEVLFSDGEDNVHAQYLQKLEGSVWINVLELHLEGGRSWGDEIDNIYRHTRKDELLVHVSGFGYWGDTEYFQSTDGGTTWEPTQYKREPNPADYSKELVELVDEQAG